MTVDVKICGITDPVALAAAHEAGAKWAGFVFFERSPRHVTPGIAAGILARQQGAMPLSVGLFVGAGDDEIAATLRDVPLDILQIYDSLDRARAIRTRFGLPVWRSCPVSTPGDLPGATGLDGHVIEPRPPADAVLPGGNGETMNWALLQDWRPALPWMLAGGLTPENVALAISRTGVCAVDVSSGVEEAPGRKSPALIRNFIKSANDPCAANKK